MSAPTAGPAYAPPGAGNPAVIRGVGRCIALYIFTFGLWSFAWIYHTTKEVTPHVRPAPQSPGTRAALYIIPIYNLVLWFQVWQEISDYCRRARSQDFNVVLFFILSLLIPGAALFTLPIVQSRLNDAHRAATNGAATNAPMETIDWVFLAVGIAFILLYFLIIIIAIGSAAS
jgi:hypothetical protein